jgi:aspartate aminotransferase-like enzyme
MPPTLNVKVATEPWEFEQIHALNHKTFVDEIPRYHSSEANRLVDRFHDENTYVIGVLDGRVAGMVAIRDRRPFSLDERVRDLDAYLPQGRSICELRLLAVERGDRLGRLLPALLDGVWQHCRQRHYDLALISGITRQLHLYEHLGFEPFGPLIGTAEAQFQPMMLTLERFTPLAGDLFRHAEPRASAPASFLPGPVTVRRDVQKAFERSAISHRSTAFVEEMQLVRARLRNLTGAAHVEVLLGTGTLANDVVGAQLSLQTGRGLILSNGEFGERLLDHASRFRLPHDALVCAWGESFDLAGIERRLREQPPAWLWFVHCETSTGVLNDLEAIRALCVEHGVKLCVDAISSIGTLPVNLAGVSLASGVSGKGLGAFPGLALVFHDTEIQPAPGTLPRYLDLGQYMRCDSVPFTHSSNLVRALDSALTTTNWPDRFHCAARDGAWLRTTLRRAGLRVVGRDDRASPAIVTVALPEPLETVAVAAALSVRGFVTSAHSPYLVERNWLQICLMGDISRPSLERVSQALLAICGTSLPHTSPSS